MSYNLPTHQHQKITHMGFQINERFENTGNSEYWFVTFSKVFYDPTVYGWKIKDYIRSEHKDVKKSQIGNTYFDFSFTTFAPSNYKSTSTETRCFEIPTFSFIYESFAVGAFEYDWMRGVKPLLGAKADHNGTVDWISSRRVHLNDWYFLDPTTNVGYNFSTRNPALNSVYENTNRGIVRLKREMF